MSDQLAAFSQLNEADFVSLFSRIYEHSAWVAEALWRHKSEYPSDYFDQLDKIKLAMAEIVEQSTEEQKLLLLRAHPDLAGKAALAGQLTQEPRQSNRGQG